jgi:ATP-dependent DNA helicase RecG
MTNPSLRERFKLAKNKTATVSLIIATAIDAGKFRLADPSQTSTRYRSYIPYWA